MLEIKDEYLKYEEWNAGHWAYLMVFWDTFGRFSGEWEILLLNDLLFSQKQTVQRYNLSQNVSKRKKNVDQRGVLSTDLYVKPTDTHQFLLSSSCHPRHVMNSGVYSQALRIKRMW